MIIRAIHRILYRMKYGLMAGLLQKCNSNFSNGVANKKSYLILICFFFGENGWVKFAKRFNGLNFIGGSFNSSKLTEEVDVLVYLMYELTATVYHTQQFNSSKAYNRLVCSHSAIHHPNHRMMCLCDIAT